MSQTLNDLTGFPCETSGLKAESLDDVAKRIQNCMSQGFIQVLTIRSKSAARLAQVGLKPGIGYLVLDIKDTPDSIGLGKVVKLKSSLCPVKVSAIWPDHILQWNDKVKSALGNAQASDSTFWLPLQMAKDTFDDIIVCKTLPDYFYTSLSCLLQKHQIALIEVAEAGNVFATVQHRDFKFSKDSRIPG